MWQFCGMPGFAAGTKNLDGSYTLTLDSAERLSEGKDVKTALGNVIDFTYDGLSAYGSGWETIAAGGYFANADAISGANVASIGDNAFNGCSSLATIHYFGDAEAWTDLTTNHTGVGNDVLGTASIVYES